MAKRECFYIENDIIYFFCFTYSGLRLLVEINKILYQIAWTNQVMPVLFSKGYMYKFLIMFFHFWNDKISKYGATKVFVADFLSCKDCKKQQQQTTTKNNVLYTTSN